jgi:nitroreductase
MSTSTVMEKELSFLQVLQDRHSIRQYDTQVEIPREVLKEMLELAAKAPSSSNMQHWRFLVIDLPEQKEKLLPIANSQQQIVEASAIVAILGDTEGYRKAGEIFEAAAEAGYMSEELAKSFAERSAGMYAALSEQQIREVAIIDASLAAMQLMLVAKAKGYDTVPMGGFDRDKFKEAYGLGERYVPVMLIPIGKAAKAGHATVRLPVEEVTFWNEIPAH